MYPLDFFLLSLVICTMSGVEWAAIATFVSVCGAALSGVLHTVFQSRCKTINLCCGLVACTREVPNVDDPEEDEPTTRLRESVPASTPVLARASTS